MKCINTVIIHVKCCLYSICLKNTNSEVPARSDKSCVEILPARRYVVSVCPSICPSQVGVSVKTVGRFGLQHGGFFRPVLHCVVRKFRCLQKQRYFTLELLSNFSRLCGRLYWTDCLAGKPFAHRVHGNSLSQQTPFPTLPFVAVGTCKNKKNTSVLSQ